MDRWSVHIPELIGIFYAVNMVCKLAHQRKGDAYKCSVTATILRDSKSALYSIQNARSKSGSLELLRKRFVLSGHRAQCACGKLNSDANPCRLFYFTH